MRTCLACLVCLFAAAAAGACEDDFEALAPSPAPYSIFGYLDASADTQWIRVMPIRDLRTTEPGSFGMEVTVEHLGTGRVVALRDSLFHYTHHTDDDLGSQGAFLHNFWTTEPIEPGASYRLVVTREGEAPAEAVVQIPPDYEIELGLAQPPAQEDWLRIRGLEHLPFLTYNMDFRDGCGAGVDTLWRVDEHRPAAQYADGGGFTIPVTRREAPRRDGCGRGEVGRRDLWIVGSGEAWPTGDGYAPWTLVPEQASNVSNAMGFIGGVLTRVVPYDACAFQTPPGTPPPATHCVLRYGSGSASLRGVVRETRCGDGPVPQVTSELRELDGEPAAARRVRTYVTALDGAFEIGGLLTGMRYALRARARPDVVWGVELDTHTIHTDTLELAAPGPLRYDIGLRRLLSCEVTS